MTVTSDTVIKDLQALSRMSKRNSLYISRLLYTVYLNGWYINAGYKNIYDYALAELSFSKSTTSEYIVVAKRFGTVVKKECTSFFSAFIDVEKFDFCKLVILAKFTDFEIHDNKITPDMSVRAIKQIYNRLKKLALNRLPDKYVTAGSIVPELPKQEALKETVVKKFSFSSSVEFSMVETSIETLLERGYTVDVIVKSPVGENFPLK